MNQLSIFFCSVLAALSAFNPNLDGKSYEETAVPRSAKQADEPQTGALPRINVRVYNYAKVPQPVLLSAKTEAARIYRQSGIDLILVDCPCSVEEVPMYPACDRLPPSPAVLQVKILPESMAKRLQVPKLEFGLSMTPKAGGFALNSRILYHRVEALARKGITSRPGLLGHILAHEIGHLLLGRSSHSREGIMRAD